MRRWALLACGLGAYGVALICTAPATLMDAGLQRASKGTLRVAEARGTVWSGVGQIEVVDPRWQFGVAKSLAWHLLPASLLGGHLVYECELADAASRFRVTISPSRIEFANAAMDVPATAIGLGVPMLAPLRLTGEVAINVPRLVVERSGLRGRATLRWRKAGSALTSVSPLGEYELQIDADEAGMRATLRTLQGPLQLEGQGSWPPRSRPVFLATARAPPDQAQQIAPLLRLIAVEKDDGRFEVVLR